MPKYQNKTLLNSSAGYSFKYRLVEMLCKEKCFMMPSQIRLKRQSGFAITQQSMNKNFGNTCEIKK